MTAHGTPKFSTLVVREISAEITGMDIKLTGKAAFGDANSNTTYGWTKGEGVWSKETLQQLLALQAMMEQDLARLHFTDAESPGTARNQPLRVPSGIAEHLDEADQV